ncbi:hypothetical protein JAO29_17195 [Edaphobacter sp. HDX4]|uniref:pilus assembly protein TadG-related protein n=1 Tax=Edaphobacter sp. HDX4 TaxID=2794064 RepID=UPI002FE50EC0
MFFREREALAERGCAGRSSEAGQAIIELILLFSCLTLAGLAFGVDFANLWYHRQGTQTAADAACQAGAMDLLGKAGGLQLSSMGFTPGTPSDCVSSPSAAMCAYAKFNGYSGAGAKAGASSSSAWNTVSWTFPASVSGITAPPSSASATPYLQVSVIENVQTYFMSLFTHSKYVQVKSTCTCGLAQVKEAAPIVVLHPSMSGALSYSGGAILKIIGGPQRSLQVNSTSTTAIKCSPSGYVDSSAAGPSNTGADVGVVGAETQAQNGCAGSGGFKGFNGGTTGKWRSSVLPVPDPYAAVPAPLSLKGITTKPVTYNASTGAYYQWVGYGIDGCPDKDQPAYGGSGVATNCAEFGPGYYPNGIPLPNNYSMIIFLPGVYYVNGSLAPGGSNTLRVATPCWSSPVSGYSASACSAVAAAKGLVYSRTQGVMFYFTGSGTFTVGGGSSGDRIDNVPSAALTCDGSSPPSSLGMPTSLAGNVLWAQCTRDATYWDSGGDTTDVAGAPGNRGILMFQDHSYAKSPTLSGSGQIGYAGSLYFHQNPPSSSGTGYGDVLSLTGGSGTGSFILGNIVADQITLSGSGTIGMQLNPTPSVYMLKAAAFQ